MAEYRIRSGEDVGKWFSQIPSDATHVSFPDGTYRSIGDIVLPKHRLLVIDGMGSQLTLGERSMGFRNRADDMKDALANTNNRYHISNFSMISNGMKAIDINGSMGTIIENLDLVNQTETAIDLKFGLLTKISNIRLTNFRKEGIIMRSGDWRGATPTNSQSNHTVLNQCRAYAFETATIPFGIFNTNGVVMNDCASEGFESDYDIYLSAVVDGDETKIANNSVVKQFFLNNFHAEHQVRRSSIFVNMPSKAVVNLSGVYWNAQMKSPIIHYSNGQVNLMNIGWWHQSFKIATRVNAPRVNIIRAPQELDLDTILKVVDPIKGHGLKQTTYVKKIQATY